MQRKKITLTTGQNAVALSWSAVTGATPYSIYQGTTSGGENVYYTSSTNSFTDTGAAGTSGAPPSTTSAYINKLAASGNSWLMGGNVGIGTKTPATKLDVTGTVNTSNLNVGPGTINTDYKVRITSSDTPGGWPALFVDQMSPASNGVTYGLYSLHKGGAAANQSAYGILGMSNSTGTTGGKNIGGAITASGNTTNYGINFSEPGVGVNNYALYSSSTAKSYFAGSVGIGTATPQGALDVNSTTGAFIVPRMTTTQRDALTPVNGMILYNTTTNKFNFYENGAWVTKING